MSEQNPLGMPGPLTQAAIDKAKSLPDNQLEGGVGTTDFKSADVTFGVRRTWSNGWGLGTWVGLKVGAGKPQGSAGLTVSKKLGLLGELESMNWLQRNLPSRESRWWLFVTLTGVVTYLSTHFELAQAAFELAPIWEKRIELVSGLLTLLAAKNSYSWMPSKEKQEIAVEVHAIKKLEKLDKEIDRAAEDRNNEPPRAS